MPKTLASGRRRRLILLASMLAGLATVFGTTFLRCEVEGDSMEPTLHHGDRVLFRRRFPRRQIAPGDIVAFNDPREGEHRLVMKRVHAVDGESVTVLGDNASASTDSRVFGPIPVNEITWLLVRRYHQGDA